MRIWIFLFFLAQGTLSYAQHTYIGLRAGFVQSSSWDENPNTQTQFLNGISTGITVEKSFLKVFRLGADVLYNQRGYSNVENVGSPNSMLKLLPVENTYSDYVAVPVKLGFCFGRKTFITSYFGAVVSYQLNAYQIQFKYDDMLNTVNQVYKSVNQTKLDLSWLGELGLGYNLTKRLSVLVSASYQPSFSSITNQDYLDIWHVKLYSYSINFGIKFKI